MILAEDEVGISDAHSETMVLDGDLTPGEPLAPHLPIADDVIDLEITPNRPDCLVDLRRRPRAARGNRCAAGAGPDGRRCRANGQRATGNGQRRRPRLNRDRRPGHLPALHRARVRGRQGGAVAAVAEAAPHGGGPAADLERRRHHELRDAPDGAAGARIRSRRGARPPDHRAAREAGGDDDHARRCRAPARSGHGDGVRRRRPQRDRGDHGRPDLGGLGQDDPRPDGDGHLGGAEHPRDVEAARPAVRGERAVREAAPSRAGDRGPAAGRAAHGRAVRCAARARHDRRLPGPAAAAAAQAAQRPRGEAPRRGDSRGRGERDPRRGSTSTSRRRRTRWTSAFRRSATRTCSARPT